MWRPWSIEDPQPSTSQNPQPQPSSSSDQQQASTSQNLSDSDSDDAVDNYLLFHKKNLPKEAKLIILNMYKTICEEKGSSYGVFSEISHLTKVSMRTIKNIIYKKELILNHNRGRLFQTKKFRNIDSFTIDFIRQYIYRSYQDGVVVTCKDLLNYLKQSDPTIKCSVSTIYKLLHEIGFSFKKIEKRQYIMDSPRLIIKRNEYLEKINIYRSEHREVVYLDETFFDSNDIPRKGWQDKSKKCILKTPPSRGYRLGILHAGSSNGWIPNCLLISSKKMSEAHADYHEDMNSKVFESWFKNNLLKNIPEHSIIIMDNATYHSRQFQKIPNTSSKKEEILRFLNQQNIQIPSSVQTKKQLLDLIKQQNFDKHYVVDEMAKNSGHEVLRLPPYHCIFNPIELVWGILKSNIRKKNFKKEDISNLIKSEVENITAEVWKNCINHVLKFENSFYNKSITQNIELIINVSDSESDSDIDNYSDSDSVSNTMQN